MRQIEIEIVFVLCDDLMLTSSDLNGFNGQNTFNKIAGSEVLDEYYNFYLYKKVSPIPTSKHTPDPLKTLTISLF